MYLRTQITNGPASAHCVLILLGWGQIEYHRYHFQISEKQVVPRGQMAKQQQ